MKNLSNIKKDLQKYKKSSQAKILQRFFKTGPGEYGEGDVFLGLKVQEIRGIAKKHQNLAKKHRDLAKKQGDTNRNKLYD